MPPSSKDAIKKYRERVYYDTGQRIIKLLNEFEREGIEGQIVFQAVCLVMFALENSALEHYDKEYIFSIRHQAYIDAMDVGVKQKRIEDGDKPTSE